jgi:4-amino-4-deoxychorismate lyase
MCLFFESIKVLQGKPENLGLHEDRMNRTRSEFLGFTDRLSLENVLKTEAMSLQKCRVIYQEKIEKIEFIPYSPKIINHLRIVEEDDLQYGYKFLDRSSSLKTERSLIQRLQILLFGMGFHG